MPITPSSSAENAYESSPARHRLPADFACRYFSTPAQGGFSLIYAYELTKKPAYLAAAVQGAKLQSAPTRTISPTAPASATMPSISLSWWTCRSAANIPDVPVGHIPYGQGNEGNAMSRASERLGPAWLLNFGPAKKMTPNWFDWPVTSSTSTSAAILCTTRPVSMSRPCPPPATGSIWRAARAVGSKLPAVTIQASFQS